MLKKLYMILVLFSGVLLGANVVVTAFEVRKLKEQNKLLHEIHKDYVKLSTQIQDRKYGTTNNKWQ